MDGRLFIVLALLFVRPLWADTPVLIGPENDDQQQQQQTTSAQETEERDIIPAGGITVSTTPITPIMILPDKNTYDQGLQEVAVAQDLAKKGQNEAASDVALEAYDDLVAVHMPRRNKKKRQKLRADRHLAASVYIDSSLAYIQDYVKKMGSTFSATEEGRARLGDLRDVSMSYPELNKKVSQIIDQYTVESSSPTAKAN